jgi:hypothetical protein
MKDFSATLTALAIGISCQIFFNSVQARGLDGVGAVAPCPACAFGSTGANPAPRRVFAQLPTIPSSNATMDGWHLVRTPGPEKGIDVVSVMHTADLVQSDPEFAGLAIRCQAKARLQIAFVVITPFHPRSHPDVTVTANRAAMNFKAEVIPPGSMIALPDEAEVLAKGVWQSAKNLSVDIEGEGAKIHGAVSLGNLAGALAQLQASCP